MSTRPVSPQPVSRWPFYAGAIALMVTAAVVLAVSDKPPGYAVIGAATISVILSVGLCIVPELVTSESRLRMSEASARNNAELQARRLAQVAEQLANAVSRSQSTEEQAGQALGTLEEMVERLSGQSDEIAQTLSRNSDREQLALKAELETLHRERAEVLGALASRLQAIESSAAESLNAGKRASATTSRMLSQLAEQIDELGLRLEAIEAEAAMQKVPSALEEPPSAPPPESPAPEAGPAVPHVEPVAVAPAPAPEPAAEPAKIEEAPAPEVVSEPAVDDGAAGDPPEIESPDDPVDAPATEAVEPPAKPAPRSRAKPTPTVSDKAPVASPAVEPMELALEGMPEPRQPLRIPKRPTPGVTSLVATAYIGIGNKLYVRGEGPGLSWEQGVPMQFLAIGKWGWTTTDAAERVVARIYRNDETPMLDEDILLEPGSRADVAPRF